MKNDSQTDRLSWFRNDRLGMMIHPGLYSLIGEGTWAMHHSQIPHREYAKLADEFSAMHIEAESGTRAFTWSVARRAVATGAEADADQEGSRSVGVET